MRKMTSVDDKKSDGSLHLTGHLGDVMKESAQIAMTVSRNFLQDYDKNNHFLDKKYTIHSICCESMY